MPFDNDDFSFDDFDLNGTSDFSFDDSPRPTNQNPMSNDMYNSGPGYESSFTQNYSRGNNSLDNFDTQQMPQSTNSMLESDDELMQMQNDSTSNSGGSKGFKTIAITAAVLVFGIVVILLAVNWFLSRPKDTTINNTNNPIVEQVDNQQNNQDNYADKQDTTNKSDLSTDYSELKNSSTKVLADNSLIEVTKMPNFSDVYSSKGMIMDKGMVEVAGKNTFIPYITLTIVGNSKATDIQYFCNGQTYEAVRVGETLDVDYRIDNDYKIIIQQVSTTN